MYNYLKKINFMKLTNKLVFLGIFGLILIAKDLQSFNYSNIKINPQANYTGIIEIFLDEMENTFESITQDDLLANVDDFIDLPRGGTSWSVFGETGMNEYTFQDDEGYDWLGFRPEFKKKITNLNGKEILIQGYNRDYVNTMPGKLIHSISKLNFSNPIFICLLPLLR